MPSRSVFCPKSEPRGLPGEAPSGVVTVKLQMWRRCWTVSSDLQRSEEREVSHDLCHRARGFRPVVADHAAPVSTLASSPVTPSGVVASIIRVVAGPSLAQPCQPCQAEHNGTALYGAAGEQETIYEVLRLAKSTTWFWPKALSR
jgi:hypothetical protein